MPLNNVQFKRTKRAHTNDATESKKMKKEKTQTQKNEIKISRTRISKALNCAHVSSRSS